MGKSTVYEGKFDKVALFPNINEDINKNKLNIRYNDELVMNVGFVF